MNLNNWIIQQHRPVLIGSFIWNPSPNYFRNFSISQNIYKKDIFFPPWCFLFMSTVVTAPFPPTPPPFFLLFLFIFWGAVRWEGAGASIAYVLKSSVVLLEKVHEKSSLHPFLSFICSFLKLHTVLFSTPTVFVRSALKKLLPRMLLAANRKPRAHVLI